MAYKRKARKPMNKRKRRPTIKARTSVKNVVRREIMKQTETKCSFMVRNEETLPFTTGAITAFPLTNITQGTSKVQRIGNSIKLVGIDIRGHVTWQTDNSALVRIMLVRKRSPLDSFVANGFEDGSGNFGPLSNSIRDIYARVNTDRYTIVFNKVMTIATATESKVKTFKYWIPAKNYVQYDEGLNDAVKGHLELIIFARDVYNDAVSGSSEITYNMKTYFKDP